MGIIVQKYGGTSVGNAERLQNVASIIERTLKTNPVIAVVSAMSGTVKAEGTTSLLLAAADWALQGASFQDPLGLIEKNHLAAVDKAIRDPAIREETGTFVKEELRRLRGFLEAIEVIRELSPRSQDNLLATGERLSARLLTGVLRDRGIKAVYTDLSHAVPNGEKEVDPAFFRRLQNKLSARCRPKEGEVPVVTGFFGMVPNGLLKAVGRGYTDFTTALIAAGLGREACDEMQVWKEVDGIFTADPRKVPTAKVLPRISPTEASELTYFGSEVLHPFTMERVVSANVPIRIKNTFHPDAPGTVITAQGEDRPAAVTAVTAKRGITVVTIHSNRMFNAYGFLARVFNALERHGVVVDLVSTSEVSISCTVERLEDAERAKSDLEKVGQVYLTPGRAILAMVGEGMKFSVGTAGKMFATLGAAGVNIEMISQGASEINISCVVKEEDAEKGLKAVHQAFMETA
ncbi:MAG TPA: aspartate kinase [bacterium]